MNQKDFKDFLILIQSDLIQNVDSKIINHKIKSFRILHDF